jgi:pimeloyl-ACP methyl ester carboxylesterase
MTKDWEVIVRGNGPKTLVMLPGAMGTATVFNAVLEPLSKGMRVIVASPPAEPDATKLADELAQLLDEHNAPKVALLGTSFGGYVVQFFASRYPERVETLVLSNTFNDPSFSPRRRPADEIRAESAETMKANAIAMISKTPDSHQKEVLLEQLGIEGAEVFKARQLGMAIGGSAPMQDTSKVRVVLMDCADDPVVAPAAKEDLVAKYAGSPRKTLEKGGHFPYVNNVDAWVASLREVVGAPA